MAQYDLHLSQNRAGAGVAFDEEIINVVRGGLMTASADANRNMRWLSGGSQNDVVSVDANGDLVFTAPGAGHTQNTDTGTDSLIFELDNDGFKIELTAESASKFGVKVDGGATYSDIEAKDATFAKVTVSAAPSAGSDLTNKTYVDSIIGDADSLTYKGVIDCAANPSYPAADAGDVYFVSVAGKIGGASGIDVEVGDMLICNTDSTSSGDHATVGTAWNIVQSNLTAAVQGPTSATDGYFAIFDGTTGKLIKNGTGAPGSMAYETATDYVAKALFDANTILAANSDDTPAALTVAEQTLVGRITSGNITALTASEVRTLLDVPTNAEAVLDTLFDANTVLFATSDNTPAALSGVELPPKLWAAVPTDKIGTGWSGTAIAGQMTVDDNYFYVCKTGGTATNQAWLRARLATNW